MRLLQNITADTTGTEPWILVTNGGSFMMAIPSTASLGGGTLEIEIADRDTDTKYNGSAELQMTSLPETKLIFIPAGVKVRAQLSGSASASIPFFDLIPADPEDKNRGAGRI